MRCSLGVSKTSDLHFVHYWPDSRAWWVQDSNICGNEEGRRKVVILHTPSASRIYYVGSEFFFPTKNLAPHLNIFYKLSRAQYTSSNFYYYYYFYMYKHSSCQTYIHFSLECVSKRKLMSKLTFYNVKVEQKFYIKNSFLL